MQNLKWFLFIFFMFGNFTCLTQAQSQPDMQDSVKYELPKFVVTANRYEKNVFETNVPVSVIEKKEIWQASITSVGDLITSLAGVSYTNVGPWSQKISIRGLTGTHVLTLVDGMRINSFRDYGSHAPLIDVEQVEQVEIIRGPASILYGSEAVAGVANFITKHPASLNSVSNINVNAGVQYSTVNNQNTENFSLSGTQRQWTFLLGINHRSAEDISTPEGKLRNTGFSGFSFDAKIGFRPNQNHRIGFSGQSDRFNNVGIPIDQFAQDAQFLKYNRDLLALNYEYVNANSYFTNAKINLFYQSGERNFDVFIYQKPKGALFVNQTLNAQRQIDSFGGSVLTSFSLLPKNLFILGFDFFGEYDNTKRAADATIYNADGAIIKDPPVELAPPTPKSNRTGFALFFEDEYFIAEKWNLTAGLRFDHIISKAEAAANTLATTAIQKQDCDFSGNVGVLFRVTDDVRLMANAGRAFKAPSLQERYFKGIAQVGYLYGNPDLKSEKSFNLDTGIKWRSAKISGEFNLFKNQIDNFIVMKPISVMADTFLYDNVGKAELYGAEFQINFQLTKFLSLYMNNAYVHGEDSNQHEPLPKIQPLTSLIGVRFEEFSDAYWLELNSRIVNAQDRVVQNEQPTSLYTLFNFSSGLNLGNIFKIQQPVYLTFNINNITNRKYRNHLSEITWWSAPGKNFSFGLKTSF